MIKFVFILIFLSSSTGLAQVGIGTITPEKALHVSGDTTATIRIESLNERNNGLNNGKDLAPVYVKKNGNLTLSPSDNDYSPIKIINAYTTFATQVLATNPVNDASTVTHIYSHTFNLQAPSSIEVKYSMAYSVFQTYSAGVSTRIMDGQSRQIRTYFTVNADPDHHGQISQNYYNNTVMGTSGIFYNNGIGYVYLPAGNHTLYFYVDIGGSVNNQTVVLLGGAESLLRLRFY